MKCHNCKGKGYITKYKKTQTNKHLFIKQDYNILCNNCNGAGEVDWLDNIIPNSYDYDIEVNPKTFFKYFTKLNNKRIY